MTDKIFKNCYLMSFPTYGDSNRGYLTVFEADKEIPFVIKRLYYIYGIGDLSEMRGPHAHRKTKQVFINIKGSAAYHLDDGISKKEIILDKPNVGIYIGPEIWHYMNDFSDDIIFLAVASEPFSPKDYISEYNEFIEITKNK